MKNIYIKDSSNGIYYYRKVISPSLIKYFPQSRYFIKSLDCANKQLSVKRCKLLNAKYEYLKRSYFTMSETEIQLLVNELIDVKFKRLEDELYMHPNPKETLEYLDGYWDERVKTFKVALLSKEYDLIEEEYKTLSSKLSSDICSEDVEHIKEALLRSNIAILETISSKIERDVYQKPRECVESVSLNAESKSDEALHVKRVIPTPTISSDTDDESKLLSDVIEEYIANTQISNNWSKDTLTSQKLYTSTLLKYFSNRYVNDIKHSDILAYRVMLTKLPLNYTLLKEFKGKSLEYCIAHSEGKKRLSSKTINKYLQVATTLFNYALKNDYVMKNVALDIKIKSSAISEDTKRTVFTSKEIQQLDTLMAKENIEEYLVYKIAKYGGLRLNEIMQLTKSDIREVDSVWVMDVNVKGGKRIKNKSSIRLVPIHSALLDELLKYVKTLNDDTTELFTKSSDAFSKYFRRYIKPQITKDSTKVFYSLRHNFADELVQADVRVEHIAQLMGHSQIQSMTMSVYAQKINVKLLVEQIEKIYL